MRVESIYTTNLLDDVLAGMPGVITHAVGLIGQQMLPSHIDVLAFNVKDDAVRVDIQVSGNIVELRLFLDTVPVFPTPVEKWPPGSFRLPLQSGMADPAQLRVEGFTSEEARRGTAIRLDCVRTVDLRPSAAAPDVAAADNAKRQRFRNRASLHRRRR